MAAAKRIITKRGETFFMMNESDLGTSYYSDHVKSADGKYVHKDHTFTASDGRKFKIFADWSARYMPEPNEGSAASEIAGALISRLCAA